MIMLSTQIHRLIRKILNLLCNKAISCWLLISILILIKLASKAQAKTCVETEENVYFCTDDSQKAKKVARKTWKYYLENFGVPQIIEGSAEEMRRMKEVVENTEEYFRGWLMTRFEREEEESLKERW